ncbi:hypothetical protein AK812_SmicGene30757 [Symbiodinium microadriaticum]|uniref:Uncharacterized protein n=1 Tax=Symbiodinium microadriaticum TaxID=2951 RepID=A0A1Q9CYI3_SYMMI|nr:hypothetical protein AK812_SmicGene30757 [Symbiodinium microadriaticum]
MNSAEMVSPEMIEEPQEPEVPTVTETFSMPTSWIEGTADPPTEVATTVSVSEPSAEGAKRRRLNVVPGDRASDEPPTLTIPSSDAASTEEPPRCLRSSLDEMPLRFAPTGILYSKAENGQQKGPFKVGGLERAPRSGEHPFEALQTGAFKTKGVLSGANGRQNQFALAAKSFQGPPTVKPAGAIGDGLESLESKAFE